MNKKITQREVNKAIKQLKNERAAGQDKIIAEVMKRGGKTLRTAVWKMCCEAWRTEQVPREWMQGVVIPLYKEGDNRPSELQRDHTAEHCGESIHESTVGQSSPVCRAIWRHSGRAGRI